MTSNTIDMWGEIVWVVAGIFVLLVFAVALALPQIARTRPGSKGHRPKDEETIDEETSPDGYIDSFSKDIEEAGGGLPPMMKLAVPAVLLWWLGYIILNWTPAAGG